MYMYTYMYMTEDCEQVERPWHSIFSAKGKKYSYRLFFETQTRFMDPLQRSALPCPRRHRFSFCLL